MAARTTCVARPISLKYPTASVGDQVSKSPGSWPSNLRLPTASVGDLKCRGISKFCPDTKTLTVSSAEVKALCFSLRCQQSKSLQDAMKGIDLNVDYQFRTASADRASAEA